MFRFGGKADQETILFLAADFRQDVGRRVEFKRKTRGCFSSSARGRGQVIIRYRGRLDDNARRGQMRHHGIAHFSRSFYVNNPNAGGSRNATGPLIRMTSAPRSAAASAMAYPILPLERFVM